MSYTHTTVLALALLVGCSSEEPSTPEPSPVVSHHKAGAAATFLAEHPDIRVLDVRTQGEFDAGHIRDATLVDFRSADFKDEVGELDRTTPWLVHCQSGGRSSKAVAIMQGLGFEKLHHLDDGFRGWIAAGHDVEK